MSAILKPARGVAVFDLDCTLTRSDTYRGFLALALRRSPARVFRTASLPVAVALHLAGFRDNAWLKRRVLGAILAGRSRQEIDSLSREFVAGVLAHGLRPGARPVLERHRRQGDLLVLATASFDFYVRTLARDLGFDEVICTESRWAGDRLLPAMPTGNCYGQVKGDRVRALLAQLPSPAAVTVYSDHHADLPILVQATQPVAVHPTRKLAAAARERGYQVVDWS